MSVWVPLKKKFLGCFSSNCHGPCCLCVVYVINLQLLRCTTTGFRFKLFATYLPALPLFTLSSFLHAKKKKKLDHKHILWCSHVFFFFFFILWKRKERAFYPLYMLTTCISVATKLQVVIILWFDVCVPTVCHLWWTPFRSKKALVNGAPEDLFHGPKSHHTFQRRAPRRTVRGRFKLFLPSHGY